MRLLAAEAAGDKVQVHLLKHASPTYVYRLRDTLVVENMLHIMTLIYVTEQLEWAEVCVNEMFCDLIEPDDERDYLANIAAYLFRIGREGWLQFTASIGVDSALLVNGNYYGGMLHDYGDKICEIAPSAEELKAKITQHGHAPEALKTANDNCRSWRRMFAQICPD